MGKKQNIRSEKCFKGAIFENLMADTLHKKEQALYYYRKESGMELDFLIGYKGECVPVEVKAKTAKAKSLSTALKHPDKYHVYHAIKFGDFNVGREGPLLTLPNYMQFLLDLEPEEIILEPIDTDRLNRLAKELNNQQLWAPIMQAKNAKTNPMDVLQKEWWWKLCFFGNFFSVILPPWVNSNPKS